VGWGGHQMPCEQEDHMALELTYDVDTTLTEIAMKVSKHTLLTCILCLLSFTVTAHTKKVSIHVLID